MYKLGKTLMLLALVMICLAGCSAQKTRPVNFNVETAVRSDPAVIAVPQRTLVSNDRLPFHIRQIAEALARKITDHPEPYSQVFFSTDASPQPIRWLRDQDFRIVGIDLVNYRTEDNAFGPDLISIEMKMRFKDDLHRTASLVIRANYESGPEKMLITSSSVRDTDPYFPETQAFMVEENLLEEIDSPDNDFSGFYQGIVSRAVSLTPTDEDRRNRLRLDGMTIYERLVSMPQSERKDYWIVVFTMDRLSRDAGFEIIASGIPDGRSWIDEVQYHDFDGWRVGMFPLSLVLDWEIYYISALYTPDKNSFSGTHEKIRIGLFTTERNYRDWPAFDHETAAQGPLARNGIMLDPENHNDAQVVQSRLKGLGLIPEVTGHWDSRSEEAVRFFQQQQGLLPTGKWDPDTQKKLFWNTGL